MKVTSGKSVKLGRLKGTGKYVHIAEDADNSSLLVLGRSGSGKTYALQQIEKNIAENGGCVPVSYTHLDVYKRQAGRSEERIQL